MLGCHDHAKNTLDLNYIALAEKNAAEVYPLHFVEKIEPVAPQVATATEFISNISIQRATVSSSMELL
jgi:hypothetical protein